MNLSIFLNLLYKRYGQFIERDADTNRHNSIMKVHEILNWFTDRYYVIFDDNISFAGKVFRGNEKLPKKHAMELLSSFSSDTFKNFIQDNEITYESIEEMCNEFSSYGFDVTYDNFDDQIPQILNMILNEIIDAPRARSIRQCRIVDDHVYIGSKRIKLPDSLQMPDIVTDQESPYITALLQVYADHSKQKISCIEDLENQIPLYTTHINIQREYFFKAQSVLHKVRDTNIFTDGESEFEILMNEIYDVVIDEVIKPRINSFDRVTAVLAIAGIANITRSFLASQQSGLVGAAEKKGIVHILVNDGKVTWIYNYDTNI